VTGFGWIPFDVQPEQVESHANSQVDSKLLEELMGILEPGEELLPEENTRNEPGMLDPDEVWVPETKHVAGAVVGLVGFTALVKIFLLFAWIFAASPVRRLKWGYVSLCAWLTDAGNPRNFGETRSEYAGRLGSDEMRRVTNLLNAATYAKDGASRLSEDEVTRAIVNAREALGRVPWWKKALGWLNPSSVFKLLGGGRW
jgi:hypothetical protein